MPTTTSQRYSIASHPTSRLQKHDCRLGALFPTPVLIISQSSDSAFAVESGRCSTPCQFTLQLSRCGRYLIAVYCSRYRCEFPLDGGRRGLRGLGRLALVKAPGSRSHIIVRCRMLLMDAKLGLKIRWFQGVCATRMVCGEIPGAFPSFLACDLAGIRTLDTDIIMLDTF